MEEPALGYATTIPDILLPELVSETCSLRDLLDLKDLPLVDRANITSLASFEFSQRPPLIDFKELLSRSIPPLHILITLHHKLASFTDEDGPQSFLDPRHGYQPTPLFMLPFWMRQASAWKARFRWLESVRWLHALCETGSQDSASAAEEALGTFEAISWDGRLAATYGSPNIATGELQPLLAHSMLRSNVIDAMLAGVRRDMDLDTASTYCIEIQDLTIFYTLQNSPDIRAQYHSSRSFTAARELGGRLASQHIDRLYLPLNVRGDHWALLVLEPRTCTVHYGDSLGRPMEGEDLSILHFWLGQHDPHHVWTVTEDAPIADQPHNDDFSCGIILINAIRHSLFGEPLWTEDTRDLLRLNEYLRLVNDHVLATVSVLLLMAKFANCTVDGECTQ